MKKTIALLITFGAFASAYSQTRNIEEARRIINGEPKEERAVYGESSSRERDDINRDYDRKIDAVRRNPVLSPAQKERSIRDLENERNRKIRDWNERYGADRRDKKNDGYAKNKKYKKNNGKHLGWEKGKGNPHKYGKKKNDTHKRKGKKK